MGDRVNEFGAQAPASGFLFGEFVDHEKIDLFAKCLGNDSCGLGKPICIEITGHSSAAEWLGNRDLLSCRNVDCEHDVRAICASRVSLHDAADAYPLLRDILREIGE
ncbi:hypothetical protein XI00_13810 [Bradyrhizobium sp. CCBAU 21359]|nr:hypothetical protein [Bradyrhizobium sp. CCBAU 21359]